MILRAATLVTGLLGAGAASQYPEFSQQYVQRLGGAVDALTQVVEDFDASAAAEGLTREAALEQMTGSGFVQRRRGDMEATFARQVALREDFENLQQAGPFMRAYLVGRTDGEVARAAWRDFEPALPLSMPGAIFAGIGFLVGASILRALIFGLVWLTRWMRAPA